MRIAEFRKLVVTMKDGQRGSLSFETKTTASSISPKGDGGPCVVGLGSVDGAGEKEQLREAIDGHEIVVAAREVEDHRQQACRIWMQQLGCRCKLGLVEHVREAVTRFRRRACIRERIPDRAGSLLQGRSDRRLFQSRSNLSSLIRSDAV